MTTPLYLAGTSGDFGGYCFKSRKPVTFFEIILAPIFFYIWASLILFYMYAIRFSLYIYICVGRYYAGIIVVSVASLPYGSRMISVPFLLTCFRLVGGT